MWLLLAFGSALFAGLTSVCAKWGIRRTDATLATAVRTIVILLFAWLMAYLTGDVSSLAELDLSSLIYLTLSGLATGGSWLCYFHALQRGPLAAVNAVDKFSIVLTILLALVFLGETVTIWKVLGILLISIGTFLMLGSGSSERSQVPLRHWLPLALTSALFAALTSLLGKLGMADIPSNLGTALRTLVVLGMAWMMVFIQGKQSLLRDLALSELGMIALSGVMTGCSWLCYYRALQLGEASLVVPIDKLSLLFSVVIASVLLKERQTKRSWLGLMILTGGTLIMLISI